MRLFFFFILLYCLLPLFSKAQVNADFNSNYVEICAPGVIQFSDNSSTTTGTIVQWEWKRNGVVFSNLENPALFFSNPGSYHICLKVTNNLGVSDSLCINNYITAYRSPTANFGANQFGGCRPFPVSFTDSSLLGDAPIRQWRWDFGDGFIDTVNQNPSHIYNTVGTFDVTLVVIDTNGCSHSLLRSNLITIVNNVTATISHNAAQVRCGLPASVTFTGLSNGPNYNYTWYFGDATTASGQNVAHNYLGAGCFAPTLSVNNGFCVATATVASCITISDRPTASFTIANPTSCVLPYTPVILNQSIGQTANNWNFGDGFSSTLFQPSHPYTSYRPQDTITYLDGVFPIVLSVSNALGCTNADTQLVYVSNLQSYILPPATICAPDTMALITVSTPFVSAFHPVSWIWTVDQFLSSTGGTVFVNYLDSGLYNAHVIVTDNIGCRDTSQRTIAVGILPNIDSITIDTNYVCHIRGINFAGFGSSYIDEWVWTFSDGSGGYADTFLHYFQDTGFITGSVMAGFRSCRVTVPLDSYYILPPIAMFTPTVNCDTLLVTFLDESIGAHHWFWNFGDTTTYADTSHLQNPTYIYPGAGTYWAVLIVSNDSTNCIDSFRYAIRIGNATANFTIPDSLCVEATVVPDNLSQGANAYFWSSNGITPPFAATQAEPTMIFRSPGIFYIRLSAYDVNGCQETIQKIIHIAGLDTNIIHSPIPACRPATITFTDASQGILSPIVSRLWGTGSTGQTTTRAYSFPGPQIMPLTVTNSWGCTFPLSEIVRVGGLFMNFSSSQNICLGNIFTGVAITSSGANANAFRPFTYIWDYGDGHRDTTLSTVTNHLYAAAGTYSVCLHILDTVGCTTTLCRPNWVTVHDPTAIFTADTFFSSCPPLEVNFTNLSLSGSQWAWSFGDGSVSSLENPTHVYSTPGFYTVALTVTAFAGCVGRDTVFQMIQITGPTGTFMMPPATGCAPYTAQFTATGNNVAAYTWLFGNGDSQTNLTNAATDTTFYTYTQEGVYNPILVMDDGMGCQIPIPQGPISIVDPPPPIFSADSLICENDSIHYQILTTITSNMSVQWLFEGGFPNSATALNPTIYYPDTGRFDVQLVIRTGDCYDTLLRSNFIQIKPYPIADFEIPFGNCAPVLVQFFDSSLTSEGIIQSWSWDFGNGQTAVSQDSALWYNTVDTFEIRLIVENNFGCRDTAIQSFETYPSTTVDARNYPMSCAGDTIQLQGTGNANFHWWTTAWISDTTISNPLTIVDSSSTYILEVYNNFGCNTFDTVQILAAPTVVADAGTYPILCTGDTIQLQGIGNANFQWTSTAWMSNTTISNPFTVIDSSNIYILEVYDSLGCNAFDTVQISAVPSIVADAGIYPIVCIGDTIQLQGTGNANFHWTSTAWVSDTTISNPFTVLDSSNIYILEVYGSSGCNAFDTVEILTAPPVSADAGAYPAVCVGDTVQLQGIGNANFHWTSTAWLSDSTISNPLTVLDTAQTYILEVYNALGCNAFDTVEILTVPLILVDAGDTAFICLGETVVLQGTSNIAVFDWGTDPSLSCQFCNNPIASPTNTQVYYLQSTTSSNCFSRDSVLVVVYPLPLAQIVADSSICEGDTVQLFASGGQVYNWLQGNNLSSTTISNPIATPSTNSIYTVEITDANGCKDSISTSIFIRNNNFTPLNDQTICLGDTVLLNLANASNPTWTGNFLSCTNCLQPLANPTDSSEYLVSYYNTDNCLVRDSLWVNILDLTNLQALHSDTICAGDSVQLGVLGNSGAAVIWTPNYALSANNILAPIATPSIDTYYVVQVNQGSCSNSDTVFISILPRPNIAVTDTSYCIGDTVQLFAIGNATNYQWIPSTFLSDSSIYNPFVTATNNQQYQVIGTGLCGSDTAYSSITVFGYPTMQLDSSLNAALGSTITLQTNANPSNIFAWLPPDDLSCADCPNPSWLVDGSQTFYVTVTNLLGCSTRDSIVISFFSECIPDLVFVPNAFSPDGDGHNDILYAQSGVIQEIKIFQIYNRWGQLVFETKDMLQGWDGTFQGKECAPDVFGYYVVFKCLDSGEEMLKKGNITIIR